MTTESKTDSTGPDRKTLVAADQRDLHGSDAARGAVTEFGCLEEIREILDLTRGEQTPETGNDKSDDLDDEDSNTQQLKSAISDFLNRVSVDGPDTSISAEPSVEAHRRRPKLDREAMEKALTCDEPTEPTPAPETTDILERFRDLARLSADDAIGQHSMSQTIVGAKRCLWTSSLAILGTCGLLNVPWEPKPELNMAIGIAFALAVGSTLRYCLLVRKLRRDVAGYQPNP